MIPHCLKTVDLGVPTVSQPVSTLSASIPSALHGLSLGSGKLTREAPDLIAPVTLALTPWQFLKQAHQLSHTEKCLTLSFDVTAHMSDYTC